MEKQLAIGGVRLDNNLVMAPMAGITDMPFRLLAKEGGAGLVCTEMVSAKALVYGDRKTRKIIALSPCERPVSVQVFGAEPLTVAEAAKIAEEAGADIVDINLGCPAPKIMRSGAGVMLIENERLLAGIMEATVKSVGVPVTVKLRTGRNPEENVAPRLVRLAEEAGVRMVVVHGRAASQMHRGAPDLAAVAEAVAATSLPVVGNGGITDETTAKAFLEATGCAGVMVGRAAIGDPGIFRRIASYLATGERLPPPTWETRLETLRKHAVLSAEHYGGELGIVRLRKVAPYYLKGMPNSSRIRDRFNHITTVRELDDLFGEIWRSPYFRETAEGD